MKEGIVAFVARKGVRESESGKGVDKGTSHRAESLTAAQEEVVLEVVREVVREVSPEAVREVSPEVVREAVLAEEAWVTLKVVAPGGGVRR